jgi:WD40 repeat protein
MATSEQTAVFISYAHRDASELALRLQKDLNASGCETWLDVQRIGGGASWTADIEHAIDAASVVVALLTAGSYVSDICRAEQLRSLRKGKRVIPVLAQPGADVPLHLETKNYRQLSLPNGYDTQFALLLADIRGDGGVIAPQAKFRSTYVTAPPLPRNYVERRGALAALRDAVLVDDPGPSVPITALRGMGGVGKTILAQALCCDEAVQQAFPDGIVWTTVGKEPAYPLVTRMQELRRALGDEPAANESELQCIDRYRTILKDKAVLVIVDDVWRSEDVEPFIADAMRSRLLFTTRDSSIAAATGAKEHEARLLTVDESRALLARWAGATVETLPPAASDVIAECEHLPLALSMVGAMLRGKPPAYWGQVLKRLQHADLEKIQAQFPGYSHANLLHVIGVSVDALDDVTRERYFALAVLLEDMTIVPVVQRTLWNADEGDSLETAERLVGLSLASRDGDSQGIRLHDLQLDYVRAKYSDRDALTLIRSAVRMSWHAFALDPLQFASQVVGRLLVHRDRPAIGAFVDHVARAAVCPWLRPLVPALRPAGMPLVQTLEGHVRAVTGVALTADGLRIVSASWDKTVKVWDVNTGRLLRTIQGEDEFAAVAVTPDGQLIVSASWDGTVKVSGLATGELLRTLKGHEDIVADVTVTPDGQRVVSASNDRTLKVWQLDSGRLLRTLKGHADKVTGVAVTTDGAWIVSTSRDNTVKVWDVDTGALIRTIEGHASKVNGIATAPDQRALTASRDKTVKVWDLKTSALVRTLEGHTNSVYAVAVSGDGRRALSAGQDGEVKVWDLAKGEVIGTFQTPNAGRDVAISTDGRRAVSASGSNLNVWDLETGQAPADSETPIGWGLSDIVVTPDRHHAVCAADYALKIVDIESAQPLRTLQTTQLSITCAAVSTDGRWVASGSWENSVKLWDLESGELVHELKGHTGWVTDVAFTPDCLRIVSADRDGTVRVWTVEHGEAAHVLESRHNSIESIAIAHDGKTVVAGSHRGVIVWDLESGKQLHSRTDYFDTVAAVAIAPDGLTLVAASGQTLKAWEFETGKLLRTFQKSGATCSGLAFSPDGTRLASVFDDKTMRLWDARSGQIEATFTCDFDAKCCAFVDDRRILLGDHPGHLHVLSLANLHL